MTAETPENPQIDPPASKGLRRVRAVTGAGVDRLEHAARRQRAAWPRKGGKYQGVLPGQWRSEGPLDETGQLPADCPVTPLGYEGERMFFVDTMGQVFDSAGRDIGVGRMQILFAGCEDFLCWAWPSFDKKGVVTGFKAEEVRRDLFAACRERGPWSPTDMVRGRGGWPGEDGRLILHCGEQLWIDGKLVEAGEHGDYFYVRRPKATLPWRQKVELAEDNPAVDLVKLFSSWRWVRGETDVMLLLGWIGVAMYGAALDWRPSVFLVGDYGTGKSSLQKLIKIILGRGMIATTNATSAGLYQIVGHDSLPIGIDEIEGDDAGTQAQDIIKMARDAASGSMRIRGGADHKGVEFAARSAFLFSAINPPPINRASLSRLAILQMRELPKGGEQPVLREADTIGPKLLRRLADHWRTRDGIKGFNELYAEYRQVLYQAGHSSRGQDTFGTFLAAAHTLLGDEGMEACGLPWEDLSAWGERLHADIVAEVAGGQPNWSRCIEEILISPVDAWNKGDRKTVGQLLADLRADRNLASKGEERDVAEKLGIAGLGIVERGRGFAGYALAVPNEGRDITKLMADTSWSGGKGSSGSWAWALRQAPAHIVRAKLPPKGAPIDAEGTDNRVSIGGQQRRCMFIGLEELDAWQKGEAG